MKRESVEEWISARRAEGLWVQKCLSCGSWFAQPRMGRRGFLCDREVCIRAYAYRRNHGRMPPEWLWCKWREEVGDRRRIRPSTSLRFEEAA